MYGRTDPYVLWDISYMYTKYPYMPDLYIIPKNMYAYMSDIYLIPKTCMRTCSKNRRYNLKIECGRGADASPAPGEIPNTPAHSK